MKRFILVCLVAMVAGCGGGEDSASCANVNYALSGQTVTLTLSGPSNVNISGTGNTITVDGSGSICTMNVSGVSNLIHFNQAYSVGTCNISGPSNTFEKPAAMALACNESAAGTTYFNY